MTVRLQLKQRSPRGWRNSRPAPPLTIRRAIAEARAAREAVKEAARLEELRLKAAAEAARKAELDDEHRAAEAAAEAAEAEKKLAKHAQASLILAQEVERKATRDAKYAARKLRAKGG